MKKNILTAKRILACIKAGCSKNNLDNGLDMDKLQIQERTKKLLEKTDKPKEFTRGLQELLKSYVDREATKF